MSGRLLPLLVAHIFACAGGSQEGSRAPLPSPVPPQLSPSLAVRGRPSNVLLVVLDDVGAERVAAYGSPYLPPATPSLTALCSEGVRFAHAWSNPVCSPTRATLLTGRYGRRTGVGKIIDSWNDEPELELAEVTLPELLASAQVPYDRSAVGKWHLGSLRTDPTTHPGRQGFSWWSGTLGNLRDSYQGQKSDAWGYFRWMKSSSGAMAEASGYVTTDTANDAAERLSAMAEPWFLYVAFNAAHFPIHTPPPGLGLPGVTDLSPDADRYDSALVALDTELGRLLAAMKPEVRANTYVIVVGDNGTPDFAIRPPLDPDDAKGSVMELGVHVPLIVTGPGVPAGMTSRALVHTVDVFATVAEIAGVPLSSVPSPVDGVSFLPSLVEPSSAGARRFLFTEKFDHNGPGPYERVTVAIRDESYKLVIDRKRRGTVEALFRMGDAWIEGEDLLPHMSAADRAANQRLRDELERLEGTFPR